MGTRGIGSKLMSKMGYVKGQGLGKDSGGRVLPVEATILPSRKSLDVCIKMKNAKRLRNVGEHQVKSEKRPKIEDKDSTVISKSANHTKSKGDVFSFMNKSVGARASITVPDTEFSKNTENSNTTTKSTLNSSISQIHKMCADKSQRQLNTMLMQ